MGGARQAQAMVRSLEQRQVAAGTRPMAGAEHQYTSRPWPDPLVRHKIGHGSLTGSVSRWSKSSSPRPWPRDHRTVRPADEKPVERTASSLIAS